jgi:hypothetical protein
MRELVSNLVAKVGRGAPRPELVSAELAAAEHAQGPFRLRMTSSLAVVMLSVFSARPGLRGDRPAPTRVMRHSPYGVDETLRRIELAVREQGLTIMARLGADHHPVIVLASSVGGTPVLMSENDSHPDMPLSVQIRASFFGGSDVVMVCPSRSADTDWCDLPDSVIHDIASLPQLVEAALS